MKKFFSILTILCLCLSFGMLAACGGGTKNDDKTQDTEYTITAQSEGCSFDGIPAQAKEGEKISFTVSVSDSLKTVEKVMANDNECTFADGKYSFTMPAQNVQVTATVGYVQKEILSDDALLWSANVPSQICKAREEDGSWPDQMVHFEFSEPKNVGYEGNVTVTSLNPEIIPQSALTNLYTNKLDNYNGFCDYGSFRISLDEVSLGTAYIAVHAKTSSVTPIDATIIKKIEVVNYGELQEETWQESVKVDLSRVYDEYKDNNIQIQISDPDHQYGTPIRMVTVAATVDVMPVTFDYIPNHNYSITVYYGEHPNLVFFTLNESVTANATYQNGDLVFTQEGVTISVDVVSVE